MPPHDTPHVFVLLREAEPDRPARIIGVFITRRLAEDALDMECTDDLPPPTDDPTKFRIEEHVVSDAVMGGV